MRCSPPRPTRRTRGRAFGLHRAMDTSGAIIGPLVALALLAWFGHSNYRPIFLAAFIPAVRVARRHCSSCESTATSPKRETAAAAFAEGVRLRFLHLLGTTLVFAIREFQRRLSRLAGAKPRARRDGRSSSPTCCTTSPTPVSLPAGIRPTRIGRKPVLVAGLRDLRAGVRGVRGGDADDWIVWVLFVVYGAYIAFTDGVGKAYIATSVPDERRGTALGLYNASMGVMLLFASLIGGGAVGPRRAGGDLRLRLGDGGWRGGGADVRAGDGGRAGVSAAAVSRARP